MGRPSDPAVARCEHGYERIAAQRDCPRCADRLIVPLPAGPRAPQTRWHGTDTTLGPLLKVAITVAIVVPLFFMAYGLMLAGSQPVMTFFVVPVTGLAIFAAHLLPELWAPERRPVRTQIHDLDQSGDTADAPEWTSR